MTNKKIILSTAVIFVAVLVVYILVSKPSAIVKGVFYNEPSIEGTKVYFPYDFLNDNKLVFIDVKLRDKVSSVSFQNRVIPLGIYRDGEYLPLLALLTPSGKVLVGIRVCEPCGSFSFHVSESKYIVCDACGTMWDIETLAGVSGGCVNYPPPRLPVSVNGGSVWIDASALGLPIEG